jgi:hypothetical protein
MIVKGPRLTDELLFCLVGAVTPPGYFTPPTVQGQALPQTTQCAPGTYRAEWSVPSLASSCTSCGDQITSENTIPVATYFNASSWNVENPIYVTVKGASESCCK